MEKIKEKLSKKAVDLLEYIKKEYPQRKLDIENIENMNILNFSRYIGDIVSSIKPLEYRVKNLAQIKELKTKNKAIIDYSPIPVRLANMIIKIDRARANFKSPKGFLIFKLSQVRKQLNNKGYVYLKGIYDIPKDEIKGETLIELEKFTVELMNKINKEGF